MQVGTTRTIYGAAGPKAVFKRVPAEGVLEAVLELVHPGNLGVLPPAPDALIAKAVSLGLVTSTREATTEVCVWRQHHDAAQDAEMMSTLRRTFYCV